MLAHRVDKAVPIKSASQPQPAPDDDGLGVQGIDQEGDTHAQGLTGCFYNVYRRRVTRLRSRQDLLGALSFIGGLIVIASYQCGPGSKFFQDRSQERATMGAGCGERTAGK